MEEKDYIRVPIGKKVFTVHKNWDKTVTKEGAKVIPATVNGYQNIGGKIYPILKSGGKELDPEKYHIFTDLEEAITHIVPKK